VHRGVIFDIWELEKSPIGLLGDGEVSCALYENSVKLDCLRSPHLALEHSIKENIISEDTKTWYLSKALYTSIRDLISKTLQFDVDGDKSLVCKDVGLIPVAERHIKDVVPLFYNMAFYYLLA
jgi:hypothetical protein